MQQTLINFAEAHLYLHVVLITLCTTAMLLAMTIDLVFGISKAKQRGEATTSQGFKKTAKKATKYLVPFLSLTLLDMIASFVLPAPFFSMIWAAYVVLSEFWSIRENTWDKADTAKQKRTFSAVIDNKDDIAKAVAAAIFGEGLKTEKTEADKSE